MIPGANHDLRPCGVNPEVWHETTQCPCAGGLGTLLSCLSVGTLTLAEASPFHPDEFATRSSLLAVRVASRGLAWSYVVSAKTD